MAGPGPLPALAAAAVVGALLVALTRGSRAAWAAFLAFDVAAVVLTAPLGLPWWAAALGAAGVVLLLAPGARPPRRARTSRT